MKNRATTIISVTGLLILATALAAFAGYGPGFGPGFGCDNFSGWNNNQLTAEQQEKAKTMMTDFQQKHGPKQLTLKAKMTELQALMAQPAVDDKAVDTLVEEITAMQSALFQERVAFQKELAKETGLNMSAFGRSFTRDRGCYGDSNRPNTEFRANQNNKGNGPAGFNRGRGHRNW